MPILPDAVQTDLASTLAQRQSYVDQLTSDINGARQQADLIGQYRLAAPHLPAATYAALASSGVDPNSPEFGQIVQKYTPTPQSNLVSYLNGQVGSRPKTQTSTGKDTLITAVNPDGSLRFASAGEQGYALPQAQLDQLSHDQVKQYGARVLSGLGGSSSNPFESAVDAVGGAIDSGVKGAVRWGGGALYYIPEVGYNVAGALAQPGRARLTDLLWNGTQFGQAVEHGGGSGWVLHLPEGAEFAKSRAQQQVRGTMRDPSGQLHALSPGRVLGNVVAKGVQAGAQAETYLPEPIQRTLHVQPQGLTKGHEELVYNLVSGLTDAAAITKFDPARPVTEGWQALRGARSAINLGEEAPAALEGAEGAARAPAAAAAPRGPVAGLINGVQRFVHGPLYQDFETSSRGQRLWQNLAAIDSPGELYDRTSGAWRNTPEVYRSIAAEKDPAVIQRMFGDWVRSGAINELPTNGLVTGVGGAKYALTSPLRDVRWASMFPNRVLNPDDPAQFIETTNRAATNAKLGTEARHALIDQAIGVTTANPVAKPNLLHSFLSDLHGQIYAKAAGDAWWDGPQARGVVSDLMDQAANSPADLRSHLADVITHQFPQANLNSEQLDEVANTIAGARAAATGDESARDIVTNALRESVPSLGKSYTSESLARQLSRYRPETVAEYRKNLIDAEAPGGVPALVVDGDVHQMNGPALWGQLHHGEELLPDQRQIRRTISMFHNVLFGANPFIKENGNPRVWIDALDALTGAWKTATVLSPRLVARVAGDMQAGLAASGHDNLFENPMSVIGGVIASKGDDLDQLVKHNALDLYGDKFADIRSEWGRKMAATAGTNARGDVRSDLAFASKYGEIAHDDQAFPNAWAHNINLFHSDPVARRVAQEVLAQSGAETLPDVPEGFTRLFRGEVRTPEGELPKVGKSAAGHAGEWFTDDQAVAHDYAGTFGKHMEYIDVPTADAEHYKIVGRVAGLPNEYLLPDDVRARATQMAATPIPGGGTPISEALRHDFAAGSLSQYRREFAAAGGWRELLNNPQGADAYLDEIAKQIDTITAGRPDLLEAMATGRWQDAPIGHGDGPDTILLKHLTDLTDDGEGPRALSGPLPVAARTGPTGRLGGATSRAVDYLYSHLVNTPVESLKDHAFGQFYNEGLDKITPLIDDAEKAKIRDALLTGHTQEYATDALESGKITAHEADFLAKTYAAEKVKALSIDLFNRSQFGDMIRLISPFADHWRQLITKWAHVGVDNAPRVAERLHQLNDWVENNGAFYKDQYGQLNFHVPLSGMAISALTGDQSADLTAPATGLSIATEGLPGIGGTLAVPAAQILRHVPHGQELEQRLLPFGAPDVSHGVLEGFAPGWVQKLITAARSPEGQRDFSASVTQSAAYLQARAYQRSIADPSYQNPYTNDATGQAKLHDDAVSMTRKLFVVRGISQALVPAAPQVDQRVAQSPAPAIAPNPNSPQGKLFAKISAGVPAIATGDKQVEAWRLAKEYQDLVGQAYADGGTTADATSAFIARHGEGDALLLTPQTESPIYGLSSTQAQAQWKSDNKNFARANPNVWALFAPNANDDKNFSYYDYTQQLAHGDRKLLTWDDRQNLAEYRIASAIYDRERALVGPNPAPNQRLWLEEVRYQLGQDYPGYNAMGDYSKPGPQKLTGDALVDKVVTAANDPRLGDNKVAETVRIYAEKRQEALDALNAEGKPEALLSGKTLQNQSAVNIRAWLRGIGADLVKRVPSFAPTWDSVFAGEVQEQ